MNEQDAKLVFDALKRDGECWHRIIERVEAEEGGQRVIAYTCMCGQKGKTYDGEPYLICTRDNPDFSTPDGAFWILERITDNLDIDIEFTKAGKVYYARIMDEEKHWQSKADNFAAALLQAVLEWVKT